MITVYAIVGYLLGSMLFAPFWGRVLGKKDILADTKDRNPGTANAFMQGGFWCGILTLVCDMAKGFLPVFFAFHPEREWGIAAALVLAAPVVGHIFPIYHHFRGGKGIATTFGCLLGLIPDLQPALILAFFFILYSVVIRVTPHFSRTVVTFLSALGVLLLSGEPSVFKLGFVLISFSVGVRMWTSKEEREKSRVRLLWMH